MKIRKVFKHVNNDRWREIETCPSECPSHGSKWCWTHSKEYDDLKEVFNDHKEWEIEALSGDFLVLYKFKNPSRR